MSTIIAFLQAHQTSSVLVAFWIFSAFVGSLPAPTINSGQFYQFFFKFINTIGANVSRAYSSKLPIATAQAVGVADAQEAKGMVADPPRAPVKP
jgi:hypothetical protein